MQCAKHQDHEASGVCAYSGKPYCEHELVEVNGRLYGKDHLDKVFAEAKESAKPQQPMVFMNAGGAASASAAAAAAAATGAPGRKPLNHVLHIALSVFTGGLWLLVYIPLLLMRSCG